MKKFEEVAHYYLGTGLKVYGSSDIFELKAVMESKYVLYNGAHVLTIDKDDFSVDYSPMLRSLSKLTEQITVEGYNEGKPFVPIEVFAVSDQIKIKECIEELEFLENNISILPFYIIEELIRLHFNVFGIEDYIEIEDNSKI